MGAFALGFFLFAVLVFFAAIVLTVVLGGVSRAGDKRVETEGRPTEGQRRSPDREAHGY